jgi:hypothetical protein
MGGMGAAPGSAGSVGQQVKIELQHDAPFEFCMQNTLAYGDRI